MLYRKFARVMRTVLWLGAGGLVLQAGCPAGTGKFLAPVIQPIIGQALADVTTALTTTFITLATNLLNQLFGITP